MAQPTPQATGGARPSDRGWLADLIHRAVEEPHAPGPAPGFAPGVAGARKLARELARVSGLVPEAPESSEGFRPVEASLRAALAEQADLAARVAAHLGHPPAPSRRALELGALFAAWAGHARLSAKLDKAAQGGAHHAHAKLARALEPVEEHVEARRALARDPRLGLPLLRGLWWSDARLFGRLAVRYFAGKPFHGRPLARLLAVSAREKALWVEVLLGTAAADERAAGIGGAELARRLSALSLPAPVGSELRRRLAQPRPPEEIAAELRGTAARDFVIEQALLAALFDGPSTESEKSYVDRLALALGVDPVRRMAIELRVADFYARHPGLVHSFAAAPAPEKLLVSVSERIAQALRENMDKVVKELRETGELAELLACASAGHALSDVEKRKVKEQLIDLAKVVPALAVFAAPGGMLLLPLLAKVLPFNLLPSSFAPAPNPKHALTEPKTQARG